MVQCVKPLFVTLASDPDCSISDSAPGKTADGDPSAWVPAMHIGGVDGVLHSWFQHGLVLLLGAFVQ